MASSDGAIAIRGSTSTVSGAQASGLSSIAIGGGSSTLTRAYASGLAGVAIGNASINAGANSVSLGAGSYDITQANVISIGTAAATRRVIFLSPPASLPLMPLILHSCHSSRQHSK
jgi:hypothetical protein